MTGPTEAVVLQVTGPFGAPAQCLVGFGSSLNVFLSVLKVTRLFDKMTFEATNTLGELTIVGQIEN